MTPVSSPFRCWSHQRRVSWRNPIAGPGGRPAVRVLVRPGPDESPYPVVRQVFHEPQHGVAVGVVPAADGQDRRVDRRVVLADAAVPPVVVALLVCQPGVQERVERFEALAPHRQPAVLPDARRVRRAGGERQHRARPGEHVDAEDGAARVVHVVVVAVVRRADRDDRLQRFGGEGGDLEGVETAPGDAEHADLAGAPGLLGKPVDDVDAVREFLCVVLVAGGSLAVAVAADVDAYGGVAVAGVPGVALGVAGGRPVGLAVREVFEEGGHGVCLGVGRAPDAGVQARLARPGWGSRRPHA